MLDFNKYFFDEYQFMLKNVSYSMIENNIRDVDLELDVIDSIDTAAQDDYLEVIFERKVRFIPEALFEISVSFVFTLAFRDTVDYEEVNNINWVEALEENRNPYLGNVISRASSLIATLTSSFGLQPLITPPNFIKA